MDKLDLTKAHKAYYAPPTQPVEATFGPLPYLRIRGRGAPMGPACAQALEALYSLAYAVKFQAKALGSDFVVAKLEGLWWWPDEYAGRGPEEVPREVWEWRLLIRQPEFVDQVLVDEARVKVADKKDAPFRLADVDFALWDEGPCVQILHIGPYATEPVTLAVVHDHMDERGWEMAGLHHEIYLSDPRKGDPEKAKTILRVPVAAKAARSKR